MIDRREDALVAQSFGEIDLFAVSVFVQQGGQCRVGADCLAGKSIDRCGALDAARDCPGRGRGDDACAAGAETR